MQSASTAGAMKGSAFWLLFAPGQTSPVSDGGEAGLFGIYPSDSTFSIVSSNAEAGLSWPAPLPSPSWVHQLQAAWPC